MTSMQTVWREGFARVIPLVGLESLRDALTADDCRLTQNSTTTPPPLMCVQDWPCEAADAIAWTGWRGGNNPDCVTVGKVEEHFARMNFECDALLGEPAACRWFLNWFDDTPRAEMIRELLAEVEKTIAYRLGMTFAEQAHDNEQAEASYAAIHPADSKVNMADVPF